MEPVIVVTRSPDASDEISVYGVEPEPKIVYIDLGSSFDTKPNDEEQAKEWMEGVWEDVKHLPDGHPARAEVMQVIEYTVDDYFDQAQIQEMLG